jgi:hypothetical protein
VIALNATQRAERRMFGLAARMWQSRFARAFFRVAGIGRARAEARAIVADASAPASRLAELAPPQVAKRFPELTALLREAERAQTATRIREADVARALVEAGGERSGEQWTRDSAPDIAPSGDVDGPSEHTLHDRRGVLLTEMRDALETTRARRATIAAALENVRIQLLRIGAGVGAPDDMREEIAALRALAETNGETAAR